MENNHKGSYDLKKDLRNEFFKGVKDHLMNNTRKVMHNLHNSLAVGSTIYTQRCLKDVEINNKRLALAVDLKLLANSNKLLTTEEECANL